MRGTNSISRIFLLCGRTDGCQNLLHRVFGIFALLADTHAEREDRLLQKSERTLDRIRRLHLEQLDCLFYFRAHTTLPQ